MTTEIQTRNSPRADFHQAYIDEQIAKQPKTWGQTFKSAVPYIAGAGAIGAIATGAYKYTHAHAKPAAQPEPLAPGISRVSEGKPAAGQAMAVNALNHRQIIHDPNNSFWCRMGLGWPFDGPRGRCPVERNPWHDPRFPGGINPIANGIGVAQGRMMARPPAATPGQRITQDASDIAVDAAAGAAIGAVAGCFLTPVGGLIVGILATGVLNAAGKEMRGR